MNFKPVPILYHYDNTEWLVNFFQSKLDNKQPFIVPRLLPAETILVTKFMQQVMSIQNKSKEHMEIELLPFSRISIKIDTDTLEKYTKNTTNLMEMTNSNINDLEIYINMSTHIILSAETLIVSDITNTLKKNDPDYYDAQNMCLKDKKYIPKLGVNIFNIYYNNWTHVFKGQRIMIISMLNADIWDKQIKNINKLFSHELFPETTFSVFQFQANNKMSWLMSFMNFCMNIDKIIDQFDIAFIQCQGYSYPVMAHLASKNKSIIHLEDDLLLMFGLYTHQHEIEEREALQVFKNDFWKKVNY
jgi:hypothetical protein